MPVPLVAQYFNEGLSSVPYTYTALKLALAGAVLWVLKTFFGGARNTSERNMHSKVVMMTVRV